MDPPQQAYESNDNGARFQKQYPTLRYRRHQEPAKPNQAAYMTYADALRAASSLIPWASPRADLLLTLIQFNVYRALIHNMTILKLDIITTDCVFEVSPEAHLHAVSSTPPMPIPASLAPTTLQLTVLHPPWIDLFPLPRVRDNLILLQGSFDSDELCDDALGYIVRDDESDSEDRPQCGNPERGYGIDREKEWLKEERNGMIVWGDPWDIASWEMTEGFLIKYGAFMTGCEDEIIGATNRWRKMRGERPLRWPLGLKTS